MSCFRAANIHSRVEAINKYPLEEIVEVITKKAPLITSMVYSIGFTSYLGHESNLYLISIKLVSVFMILCCSICQNNSHYVPFQSFCIFIQLEQKLMPSAFSIIWVFRFYIMFFRPSFEILPARTSNRSSSKPAIIHLLARRITSNYVKIYGENA